jgi:hypothetical protein
MSDRKTVRLVQVITWSFTIENNQSIEVLVVYGTRAPT